MGLRKHQYVKRAIHPHSLGGIKQNKTSFGGLQSEVNLNSPKLASK